MARKVIIKEQDFDLEDALEIGKSDFEKLLGYAEWAYDQSTGREATRIREFLDEMHEYLAPDEPGDEVQWITVVPLNALPFVARKFDLNEDDDGDEYDDEELLVGWVWRDSKTHRGTWEDLLRYARTKKASIRLPGEKLT